MSFDAYLSILRDQFLPSFGEIAEAEAFEFFVAGFEVTLAAWQLGSGLLWDGSQRRKNP